MGDESKDGNELDSIRMKSRESTVSVSGVPLRAGPSSMLWQDKLIMYEQLHMIDPPPKVSRILVFSVESLLLVGFVLRILAFIYSEQTEVILMDSIPRLLMGHQLSGRHVESVKLLHVLVSHFTYLVLLPQVFILDMRIDNCISRVWQFIIMSVVFFIAFFNHILISINLDQKKENLNETASRFFEMQSTSESTCEERQICFHMTSAIYCNVFILLPLLITLFRCSFAFRMKPWIARIKVVGSAFIMFSTTRVKDITFLTFQMFVMTSSISGMVYFSEYTVDTFIDKPDHDLWYNVSYVLIDIAANISSILGGLGVIVIYIFYHNKYSHGDSVVSKDELDLRIRTLIDDHREVLVADKKPSRNKYFPQTCGVQPVISGQLEIDKKFLNYTDDGVEP